MSAGEVAWRVKEQALGQIERRGLLAAARAPAPDLAGRPAQGLLGDVADVDVARYRQAADRVLEGRIALFAHENLALGPIPVWNRDPSTGRMAPLACGRTIDYRDADCVGNIKYLWELNRHLHLVTVAQAYRLTGEVRYLEGIGRLLGSWLDQCPYPRGPNWSSGLELAVRLINWSMVWQLIGGTDSPLFAGAAGNILRRRWLDAVFQHAHFIRRHLSRYSSANNHLIGEAAGLFTAWMTWPYWKDMEEWGQRGFAVLVDEALRQNGDDGVNHEQAVSYQQFVLDFLIIGGLLGRANGHHFPETYWNRVEAMLEFIASVMDSSGNVPMIGDADDGYVVRLSQEPRFCPYRSLLATGAVLFKRGDFRAKAGWLDDKTRWLLGAEADRFYALEQDAVRLPVRRAFPEGGYYILGSDFETDDEVRMIVDAGPLGYQTIAAHGHADALSVTLSVGGCEFLVDPGTYAYHTERRWRDYFRGTAAHNTARIDGQDQSLIGGSFLWLQHARAWCEEWAASVREDRFRGAHDGYMRLRDPVLHQREVRYDKAQRRFSIADSFACKGVHDVELFWHFSEECAIRCVDGRIVARRGDRQIVIRPVEGVPAVVMANGDPSLPAGWISRRFDVKVPATTVIWRARISGPAVLRTEIDCSLKGVHDNENSAGAQLERYN